MVLCLVIMSIQYGQQVIFKADNVVPRELDSILDEMISKKMISSTVGSKCIDVDVSNVIQKIIKAEFKADYVMAYRFRSRGLTNLVYSIYSDMFALCDPSCISIHYFNSKEKKGDKRKKRRGSENIDAYVFHISGGSNVLMKSIRTHIELAFPASIISWTELVILYLK